MANANNRTIDNIQTIERLTNLQAISDWNKDRWIWKRAVKIDARLSDPAKLLAVTLCDDFAHHETGFCNPSIGTLAGALGKSDRSVQRALSELRNAGWIEVQRGNGRGNSSKIIFLKGDAPFTFSSSEKVTRIADHRPEKVTNVTVKGDRSVAPYNRDKPKKNQKAQPSACDASERPFAHLRAVAVEWSNGETEWNEWLAKHGLPTLRQLGRRSSNRFYCGWDVPYCIPPSKDDPITQSISLKFFRWCAFQKGFIQ